MTQFSSSYAVFLHRSRLDIVRLVRRRVALFSEISSNRSLHNQHFNDCDISLVLSLNGHTLLWSQNWRAMDGTVGWSRIDGSIPSSNRYRRIDWGTGRLLVHSKAAAPQVIDAIRRLHSLRVGRSGQECNGDVSTVRGGRSAGYPVDAQDVIYHDRNHTEPESRGNSPSSPSGDANCQESNPGTRQHNQHGSSQDKLGVKRALPSEPLECATPIQAQADNRKTPCLPPRLCIDSAFYYSPSSRIRSEWPNRFQKGLRATHLGIPRVVAF